MKRLWILAAGTAFLFAQLGSDLCRAEDAPPPPTPTQPILNNVVPIATVHDYLEAPTPVPGPPVGAWVEMRPAQAGLIRSYETLSIPGNGTMAYAAVPAKPFTYLGIALEGIDEPLRTQLQIPDTMGLLVSWVDEESPSKGVLEKYDVILRLDDQMIINADQLQSLVRMHKPGDDVTLHIVRQAKAKDVTVKLVEKKPVAASADAYWTIIARQAMPPGAADGKNLVIEGQWRDALGQMDRAAFQAVTAEPTTKPIAAPAPPDRATIARRLYLDVTGVPPTPRQIEDFVNDKSPDAYQKLVDELIKHRPVVIEAPDQNPASP